MFAFVLTALFALMAIGFVNASLHADSPRGYRVLAALAFGSALMSAFVPAVAGVVLIYWIGTSIGRVSPFKNSLGQIALGLALVVSAFAIIGMIPIPAWIIITGWSVLSIVGFVGWIDDNFGGIGRGGS